MDPALPTSWKTLPIPDRREPLGFEATYTAEEAEAMALGLVPQQMEDKWFIYAKGDHLYFHRSWTGACIFGVRFEETPEGYQVVASWVNRDPDQYSQTDTAYDRALLSFLIDAMLLEKSVPFPRRRDQPAGDHGVYQHHVVGKAYPEQPGLNQTPEAGEPSASEPQPLPPRITGRKLAVGLALITVAFLAFWTNRVGVPFMNVIGFLCITAAHWSIHPPDAKQPIKPRDLAILLISLIAVVGLIILLKNVEMPPRVKEGMTHPAIFLWGWLLCCGALFFRWWKVRNNPLPVSARGPSPADSPENW